MKIILSRKGFDSSAGGVANPIFPDGRLLSLPIPDTSAPLDYGLIHFDGGNLALLVTQLTKGRMTGAEKAHLDPDLDPYALPRARSWQPSFGQSGAAQGHLISQAVGPGDLFLFFGWFRRILRDKGVYGFEKTAPDLHVLFGWLQIDRIVDLNQNRPSPRHWMAYHPHLFGRRGRNNAIYLGRKRLSWPHTHGKIAGAGLFPRIKPELILTEPNRSRTHWLLPAWFHPDGRRTHLSYHGDPTRWSAHPRGIRLKSVARGQEYVLNCEDYPEAVDWVRTLFRQ